jgi:hypothetical protein
MKSMLLKAVFSLFEIKKSNQFLTKILKSCSIKQNTNERVKVSKHKKKKSSKCKNGKVFFITT